MFLKSTPKPQVFLQLGWSKPTGWGPTGWKAALQKSSWRAGAEHKAAVSPAARAASCIQGCIRKGMAEGGGDSPLFSADNAVSGVWCPAEGAGFAQSKEEEAKERHYCYLLGQYRSLFLEVHSDETRCSGHKLQLGKMQLGIRKSFFISRVDNSGTDCVERLWSLHPRRWKPDWKQPWATCSSQTCSEPQEGLDALWRSLPTYNFPWFFNKYFFNRYFSSAWSNCKIFLCPWSVLL